jgi:hypothetical protein
MRCLLDKVIVRYTFSGLLKLSHQLPPNQVEAFSLDLYKHSSVQLFMVTSTHHRLQQLQRLPRYLPLIQAFYRRVQVLHPSRYFKRWSRRLRGYGFSREDAAVLALATFGTDESGDIIGTYFVATYDQPMMTNWIRRGDEIADHLAAMRRDLPEPYDQVSLPLVKRPEAILALI